MMNIVDKIILEQGLNEPDGRPLHNYPCSAEDCDSLRRALHLPVSLRQDSRRTACEFVFWAAEHIRTNFQGGQLTWAYLFEELGFEPDRQFGVELVGKGLRWWRRHVRVSEAGRNLYLYSLMAEGGMPDSLLRQDGLYQRVVMGLLYEIEKEGGAGPATGIAERIAARWIAALPMSFHNVDCTRLLADLALSLAELRARLPDDLPPGASERWLDAHVPEWSTRLPLRLSRETREALIRPALSAERGRASASSGPFVRRELRRDENGGWCGVVRLDETGWLDENLLPEASGLRLRLLPSGELQARGISYTATPESGGWQLRQFPRKGAVVWPFEPWMPLALAAYADGVAHGEAVVDPGLPSPDEAPSLWRAADPGHGAANTRLLPVTGGGRTSAAFLWALTPESVRPLAESGLTVDDPEPGPEGSLWRLSGRGNLRVGSHLLHINTGADSENDTSDARLVAVGRTFPGWRIEGGAPIFLGRPEVYGARGSQALRTVPDRDVVCSSGRLLGAEILAWRHGDEALARLRVIWLPKTVTFDLKEIAPGRIKLIASGVPAGWRLRLRADEAEVIQMGSGKSVVLPLAVSGAAPGLIQLRLSDPARGKALELHAPWPAHRGMLLDPSGQRLTENRPLDVMALRGWRAVVPIGASGDLQLRLTGQAPMSVRLAGDLALVAHLPLIRAMLAQGGPDAQVNLRLIVGGEEGHRLEIRRYQDQSAVQGEMLFLGLGRDTHAQRGQLPEGLLVCSADVVINAVDLSNPDRQFNDPADRTMIDLARVLGEEGGPWLIQSSINGQVQRAAVWSAQVLPGQPRDDRILNFAERWKLLLDTPGDPGWEQQWKLIEAVADGDAGVLDQVQALARVPAAAVALLFRVPRAQITDVLAMELAAPLFWPVVPVNDFVRALAVERSRQCDRLGTLFDGNELDAEMEIALAHRLAAILALRPDLAGHLGAALEPQLLLRFSTQPEHGSELRTLLLPNAKMWLAEKAQEAARRFGRLPDGVGRIKPLHPLPGLEFNSYAQPLVDSPLVAAEMATGLRPAPSEHEMRTLIYLRLVDPIYFDDALPAAVAVCMELIST